MSLFCGSIYATCKSLKGEVFFARRKARGLQQLLQFYYHGFPSDPASGQL